MDDNNSRSLDKYEFNKAMKDFGLGFNDSEISTLFSYFDFDHSGALEYDEFIRAIRGPMNPARKRVVVLCFKKLDKDNNGWVDINDVRGAYNAKKHPDVIAGKKTEDQILQEFLQTFEIAHSIRNSDAPNYVVTKEEFEEYYNNISASVDNDSEFELILTNAWRLTEESRKGMGTKGWASEGADKPTYQRGAQPSNIFNRDDFGS